MTPNDAPNPYATAAAGYWQAGWRGILPLPEGRKHHPPSGYTGARGHDPSWADIQAWIDEPGPHNIALRLPDTVIGVDVDHYGAKTGGHTLTALEATLGPLPSTWRSTSRDDGISGIRLYRIPELHTWPDDLGDGIDVIRRGHRYVVAAPSLHPEGGTYKWITPDGAISLTPPAVDELPALPEAWVNRFATITTSLRGADPDLGHAEVTALIAAMPTSTDLRCRHMDTALEHLDGPGSRHDRYNRAILATVSAGRDGCPGALQQLTELRSAFLADVGPDRGHRVAVTEFARSLAGATAKVLHKPQGEVCIDLAVDQWLTDNTPTAPTHDTHSDITGDTPTSTPADDTNPADTPTTAPTNTTTDTTTSDDGEDVTPYDKYVRAKAFELQVVIDAKQLVAARHTASLEPLPRLRADDYLNIDYPPLEWVIDQLWPAGGRVVLSAAAKSGKSTLILNLVHSLLDQHPFLATWEPAPDPDRRIVLLNMEIGDRQYQTWLRRIRISQHGLERLHIANLRGKANLLGLASDAGRERFVNWLGELGADTVILDPLAPVLASLGVDENDNTGVAQFFDYYNQALVAAGISNDFIAHHTGRANSNRSRGASRLDDEPDVVMTLRRDGDDPDDISDEPAPRLLHAYGRDVDLPDTILRYDPTSGLLHATDEHPHQVRQQRTQHSLQTRVIDVAAKLKEPISVTALGDLCGDHKKYGPIINAMIEAGQLHKMPGKTNGKRVLPLELGVIE